MTKHAKTKTLIVVLAIAAALAGLIYSPRVLPPTVNIPNTELLNQQAERVNFARDVVANNIVVINFIYTDCKTACPVVSAIFEKLQNQLGEKLKQNVRMVTLSINPVTDTPEKLKIYANRFHAQPEWLWLTGEKTEVNNLLKELGVYEADYANHAPVILVGDANHGWTRFNDFTSPETLAAKIDELLAARHEK